jgi:hypothetical protein
MRILFDYIFLLYKNVFDAAAYCDGRGRTMKCKLFRKCPTCGGGSGIDPRLDWKIDGAPCEKCKPEEYKKWDNLYAVKYSRMCNML